MKNPNPKIPNRALSVRQPLAEKIMRGTKKIEYRSISTNIRGRVYIYASKAPATWAYEKMKTKPGDFPVGMIVGTVEITKCTGESKDYHWHLKNPKRLRKPIKPDNQGQPVWFKPFKKD